jgi:hypothetical protein
MLITADEETPAGGAPQYTLKLQLYGPGTPPKELDCYKLSRAKGPPMGTISYSECMPTSPKGTYSAFSSDASAAGKSPGQTWKYLAGPRNDLPTTGTAWFTAGFKDRRWKSGAAPLGRGTGATWATPLPTKKLRASGATPHYFRGMLCLTAASAAQVGL